MNDKVILESLAMDLKRVALGFHRGSMSVAERFIKEALKRKGELDVKSLEPYVQKLIFKMEKSLKDSDNQKRAEDALMYSTLFQNAALKVND